MSPIQSLGIPMAQVCRSRYLGKRARSQSLLTAGIVLAAQTLSHFDVEEALEYPDALRTVTPSRNRSEINFFD